MDENVNAHTVTKHALCIESSHYVHVGWPLSIWIHAAKDTLAVVMSPFPDEVGHEEYQIVLAVATALVRLLQAHILAGLVNCRKHSGQLLMPTDDALVDNAEPEGRPGAPIAGVPCFVRDGVEQLEGALDRYQNLDLNRDEEAQQECCLHSEERTERRTRLGEKAPYRSKIGSPVLWFLGPLAAYLNG